MSGNNWMAFVYRDDFHERAHTIGSVEAQHERERLLEAADFNSSSSSHATRESAELAAREKLRRLREVDASIPWVACVAYPHEALEDLSRNLGTCYSVED